MIKFAHERVFDARPIDFVIENVVENSPGYYDQKNSREGLDARLTMLTKFVGALAMLLTVDQQQQLVEEFSNHHDWTVDSSASIYHQKER